MDPVQSHSSISSSAEIGAQRQLRQHSLEFENYLQTGRTYFNEKYFSPLRENATLLDFEFLKTVGTGAFGVVITVSHKKLKKIYAMKAMEKAMIVRGGQTSHLLDEVRVSGALRFPFCVHLSYFLTDNVYIYLVFPYLNGGDMFKHLRAKGRFSEDLSRFYAAQVILALEYMHKMGLIYRDIKPENILIDSQGYLKLVDYGFCKKVHRNKTYTMCGTPEYLAPEVVLNQGYTRAVDFWSLGILIYEMNAGRPPFQGSNHMSIYEKICHDPIKIPGHFTLGLAKLLSGLIARNTTRRIGNLRDGMLDVKAQDWFVDLDWNQILMRQIVPEFSPGDEYDPSNTSNFDELPQAVFRGSTENECKEIFKSLYEPLVPPKKRISGATPRNSDKLTPEESKPARKSA